MKTSKTFKVLFWQNVAKRKGLEAPIYVRITVSGRRVEISLGKFYPIEFWDNKMSRGVGRTIETRELNFFLDNVKIEISDAYYELEKEGRYVTANSVKARYLGTDNHDATLLELIKFHFDKTQGVLKWSTLKNYYTTKNYVKLYLSKKMRCADVPLAHLSYNFIVSFEQFLRNKENHLSSRPLTNNGVMKHVQRLNKLMNLATKLEWIDKNPFLNFDLRFKKFDRPFLSSIELEKFTDFKLSKPNLKKARDIFVFACYTGLSYIDVKKLTKDNLVLGMDGKKWLFLYREKSGERVKVPLLSKAVEILEEYENFDDSNLLLPVYSNQKMNQYVREVAAICDIGKRLSFHVARHTFATTVTLSNGVPIETVSKLLGHSKLTTTQIYARVLEDKLGNDIAKLQEKLDASDRNAS